MNENELKAIIERIDGLAAAVTLGMAVATERIEEAIEAGSERIAKQLADIDNSLGYIE